MNVMYHLIIGVALLVAAPYLLARMALDRDFREEVSARLFSWRSLPQFSKTLWVHASSVGEVKVAKILIQKLREKYPDRQVVLSTFTATGYELARTENLCPVFRLPPDSALILRPLLKRIDPAMLLLIEAEFWPALLSQCRQKKIPVLLLNGRVSEKSYALYKKIQPLFRWLTHGIAGFFMRSHIDADRLLKLKAKNVRVTGNMKFDALPETLNEDSDPTMTSVVFGSTRPGDEAPILDAVARLRKEFPDLKFVIAPRHVHRCDEVADLIRAQGLSMVLHSQIAQNSAGIPLILVDRIGVLNDYYRQGSIAFVGGGFSAKFGGQNILEPAGLGRPVIFGRHMNNFAEEAGFLSASGGGIQIDRPADLYTVLQDLLRQPEEVKRLGALAAQTVNQHRGATERNLEMIDSLMNSFK